jgi:protein ImuB
LTRLDRARGDRPDPRAAIELPATFDARLELFERADSSEQLMHGAAVLLARLVAWAQAQQARIGGFRLLMRHEPRHRDDGRVPAQSVLDIALAETSNDVAHLQLLLSERLARMPLPAPTLELRLQCSQLQRSAAPNGELFPTSASAREGLVRLIERLQARLGPQQVQRPVLVEDHRPERGTAWQPALPAPSSSSAAPAAPAPLTRPVWLLPQPKALHERQSRPLLDGRPLQLLAGPERIEAGWWDSEPAARDYFIAQAHDGALVWVNRSRLALADEGWFLHGRFG